MIMKHATPLMYSLRYSEKPLYRSTTMRFMGSM